MFDTPASLGRPDRTFDGQGAVEVLNATETIWLDMSLHKNQPTAIVDGNADVRIGDLIGISSP